MGMFLKTSIYTRLKCQRNLRSSVVVGRVSDNTLGVALRRIGYSSAEMTAHGFRTLASTIK
jgi:hypothetical protein